MGEIPTSGDMSRSRKKKGARTAKAKYLSGGVGELGRWGVQNPFSQNGYFEFDRGVGVVLFKEAAGSGSS